LGVKCADGVVVKVKATPPLKDSEPGTKARLALLENAFRIEAKGVSSRNVLLFDDTYDSGATMKSVAEKLYSDGHAATVYALTLTITRTGSRS
jgi:predicted amidophosphoribosyltransferase